MWLILLLLAAVAWAVGSAVLRWVRLSRALTWVPGPKPLPILGNSLDLLGKGPDEILKQQEEWRNKYGDLYVFWIGLSPIISVQSAEHMQIICKYGKELIKTSEYRFFEAFIGNGLISSTGEKWFHRRRLMNNFFNKENLYNFTDIMNKYSRKLTEKLKMPEYQKELDFLKFSKLVALDILIESLMGTSVHALKDPENSYTDAIEQMSKMVIMRSFSPLYRNDTIFSWSTHKKKQDQIASVLKNFTWQVIEKRISERKQKKETQEKEALSGKITKTSMMDMLLDLKDSGQDFSTTDIEEEITTFAFAGHDTTSIAVSYLLFNLGRYPKIQEDVLKEIDNTITDMDSEGVTQLQLSSMDLLERCLKESMRLFTPVPMIGKIIPTPIKFEEGEIPANVDFQVNMFNLHRNEKYYDNPCEFDPDRFLPERSEGKPIFSYVPFSAGPRNCIGLKYAQLEVKVIVCHLLKKFRVETLCQPDDLRVSTNLVLTPLAGIPIRLHPRC